MQLLNLCHSGKASIATLFCIFSWRTLDQRFFKGKTFYFRAVYNIWVNFLSFSAPNSNLSYHLMLYVFCKTHDSLPTTNTYICVCVCMLDTYMSSFLENDSCTNKDIEININTCREEYMLMHMSVPSLNRKNPNILYSLCLILAILSPLLDDQN